MKFLSSLAATRFPLVGATVTVALLTLLIYVPEVTMIWLPPLLVAVICAYFLSRFPVRRMAPADLRSATFEKREHASVLPTSVDPTFSPRFIRPLPELLIIGGCALVVTRLFSERVYAIFPNEIGGAQLLVESFGVSCAVLAGHEMLRCRTNEFVLRARQSPAWPLMLASRSVLVFAILLWRLPFAPIPGITLPGLPTPSISGYISRMGALAKNLSPSRNVSVEIRKNASVHEVWVRDCHNLKDTSLVGSYGAGVTAMVSPDDGWLAVNYSEKGTRGVALYKRVTAENAQGLLYLPDPKNFQLLEYARNFYLSVTNDGTRFRYGRACLSASGWHASNKLLLELTFTDLSEKQRVPPWLCTYSPKIEFMEAVSKSAIIDKETRERQGSRESAGPVLKKGTPDPAVMQRDAGRDRATEEREVFDLVRKLAPLNKKRALAELLACYQPQVSYYDRPGSVDRAFIEKEKKALFDEWPVAEIEVTGAIDTRRRDSDGTWMAVVPTRFVVRNPSKGTISEGEERTEYTIAFYDGVPKIVGERSIVTGREKKSDGLNFAPEVPMRLKSTR